LTASLTLNYWLSYFGAVKLSSFLSFLTLGLAVEFNSDVSQDSQRLNFLKLSGSKLVLLLVKLFERPLTVILA
jgi:hypothetical protein